MQLTPRAREHWLDIAKGMGIVCVALVHIYPDTVFFRVTLIFLLPLFFFISGYLLKPAADIRAYAVKKARCLLLPYISFMLVYVCAEAISIALFRENRRHELVEFLTGIPREKGRVGEAMNPFWFVPVLFASQQIVNLLVLRFRKPAQVVILSAMLCAAYLNSVYLPTLVFPWYLNVSFIAAPIIYIGYRWGRQLLSRFTTVHAVISIAAVAAVVRGWNLDCDMKDISYGTPVVALIVALSCTHVILKISMYLQRFRSVVVPLRALGNATLVILLTHQAIMVVLEELGVRSRPLVSVVCVSGSYLVYLALKQCAFTRRFFLGELVASVPSSREHSCRQTSSVDVE
jgi:fucose 4-O-acetylase-like acetyltransferase